MTADRSGAPPPPQRRDGSGPRYKMFAYISTLMMLTAFCDPNSGLMDVPVSFLLKNTLHLDALQVAQFRLVVSTPLYLSFLFGLARDNWSPFGRGDRGHLVAFALLSATTYGAFAFISTGIVTLLFALLLLTAWSLFIASAQNGLAATIGQQHAMTGQISTVWNVLTAVPALFAFLLGGHIGQLLDKVDAQSAVHAILVVGSGASLALAAFALYRPAAVYDNVSREHGNKPSFIADLRQLAAHKPARKAILIWMLWNFAPGSATPLQFYMQDKLGASAVQWGEWNAMFTASFIPTILLFGILCSRISLGHLLRWGTLVAIPQFVPLLLVDSLNAALILAIPIGLMGGLATASYVALIMRAAPTGLQGTMMMSASSVYFVATRVGDVFGSALFGWFDSFTICVVLSTVVYASIWFVLPRSHCDEFETENIARQVRQPQKGRSPG